MKGTGRAAPEIFFGGTWQPQGEAVVRAAIARGRSDPSHAWWCVAQEEEDGYVYLAEQAGARAVYWAFTPEQLAAEIAEDLPTRERTRVEDADEESTDHVRPRLG